jgi:hypothetical protein
VWGKAKAMTYALGGVLGVVYYAVDGVEAGTSLVLPVLGSAALIVFVLGAISSVLSFITYVVKAVPELKDNV